jgi:hypothetical protein
LKALGPLVLLMLLLIGVLVAGVVTIGIFFGGLELVLEKSLGFEPGSIKFVLAMSPAILGVIVLFIAISLKFSIIQFKIANSSADGKALNISEIIRDSRPNVFEYFLLSFIIIVLVALGIIAASIPIFFTASELVYFVPVSSEYLIWLPAIILTSVPGIMIALSLSLSPLALIFEEKKIGGALRRSRDLTRNNRGRMIVLYVLAFLLFLPASVLTQIPFLGEPEFTPILIPLFLLNLAVSILYSIFSVVLAVTIYRELRALKDGPALTDTAAPEPSPVG